MKPIIGIIARPVFSKEKNLMYGMYEGIIKAVNYAGGISICILPNNENLFDVLSLCDGLIFQGGDNFLNYEKECLEYAYQNNIPTLGICLGMQLMGVLFGATEYIVTGHKNKNMKYVHTVTINNNSKLYSIIKEDEIYVNSRHSTAIKDCKLNIVGISQDGIIEAIEDNNKRFFIGVQWHPEAMIDYDEVSVKLFEEFINECKNINYI